MVTGAYTQLFAEGWLEGRHGSGTYVAPGAVAPLAAPARPAGGRCLSAPAGGPGAPGGQAPGRRAAAGPGPPGRPAAGHPLAGRHRPGGLAPGLAHAGAEGRSPPSPIRAAARPARGPHRLSAARPRRPCARGPDPGHPRRGRSLGLVTAALLRPGDRVGVEEPGYQAARAVFASRGAQLVPCRVDGDGLVVDELPGGLRLVYTTPAHQYPLGGRLPVPRRQALATWARSTGALIVEDDYDGEFRYDVAPLPTLFGLDPDVVIYLGTTSKTLTPALGRAGWWPGRTWSPRSRAAAGLGERACGPVQHAVRRLLASGELERHVRRMRHEYARRRAAMTAVGGGDAGGAGPPGGCPVTTRGCTWSWGRPARGRMAAAARERGVEVATLDRYFGGTAHAGGPGARLRRRQQRRDHPCLRAAGLASPPTRRPAAHDQPGPGLSVRQPRDGGRRTGPAAALLAGTAVFRESCWQAGRIRTGVKVMAEGGVPGVEDVARLGSWLADNGIPAGTGRPVVQLIGGRAVQPDLPARVGPGRAPLILRRPPLGHVLPTAHDMAREYRVLTALNGTAVPVPRPVALCPDTRVIGAPFYLMEYVDGAVLRTSEDAGVLAPGQAGQLSERFAEMLAAIHGVDVGGRRAGRVRQAGRVHGTAAGPLAAAVGAVGDPGDARVHRTHPAARRRAAGRARPAPRRGLSCTGTTGWTTC